MSNFSFSYFDTSDYLKRNKYVNHIKTIILVEEIELNKILFIS